MRRQTVHGQCVRLGMGQELIVQLVASKYRRAQVRFAFLAHAVPGIGIDRLCAEHCLTRIPKQLDRADALGGRFLKHRRVGLVSIWAGQMQLEAEPASCRPRSEPRRSSSVSRSASTWHGCSRSDSALITGTELCSASCVTSECTKTRAMMAST